MSCHGQVAGGLFSFEGATTRSPDGHHRRLVTLQWPVPTLEGHWHVFHIVSFFSKRSNNSPGMVQDGPTRSPRGRLEEHTRAPTCPEGGGQESPQKGPRLHVTAATRWCKYWPQCCPKMVPSSSTGLLSFLFLFILLLLLFLLHPLPLM